MANRSLQNDDGLFHLVDVGTTHEAPASASRVENGDVLAMC